MLALMKMHLSLIVSRRVCCEGLLKGVVFIPGVSLNLWGSLLPLLRTNMQLRENSDLRLLLDPLLHLAVMILLGPPDKNYSEAHARLKLGRCADPGRWTHENWLLLSGSPALAGPLCTWLKRLFFIDSNSKIAHIAAGHRLVVLKKPHSHS